MISIQDGHYFRHHRLLLGIEPAPTHTNKTQGYSNEANFDTNMVIILAALLCALICVLGLNSIVRCALRCGRRMAFETPDEAAARLAATGLKKRALRQIPVTVYGSGGNAAGSPTDCPICLGEFMDGEKVRVLPKCKHEFHVRCIDTWLTSHSSCPTCRNSLLQDRPVTELEAGNRSPGVESSSRQEVIAGDESEEIKTRLCNGTISMPAALSGVSGITGMCGIRAGNPWTTLTLIF